jgi:hypothetical protein
MADMNFFTLTFTVIYQSTFIYLAIYLLKANEQTEYSDYLNEIA